MHQESLEGNQKKRMVKKECSDGTWEKMKMEMVTKRSRRMAHRLFPSSPPLPHLMQLMQLLSFLYFEDYFCRRRRAFCSLSLPLSPSFLCSIHPLIRKWHKKLLSSDYKRIPEAGEWETCFKSIISEPQLYNHKKTRWTAEHTRERLRHETTQRSCKFFPFHTSFSSSPFDRHQFMSSSSSTTLTSSYPYLNLSIMILTIENNIQDV